MRNDPHGDAAAETYGAGRHARTFCVFAGLAAMLAIALVANLCVGTVSVPVSQIVPILMGKFQGDTAYQVIWNIRLPRLCAAAILGGALGLAGMLLFIQICGLKQGILAGSFTLVMMVLPTVISNTHESLKTVPDSYREGALALGSGKWRMIRTVVLPNAMDGIVTGCILAIGRITGESAALLFTAGFGLKMVDFFQSLQSSSATLTVALYIYASERGAYDVAFAIAVILIILTFLLNMLASRMASRVKKKRGD